MAALNRLQQRIKENFHETTRDLSLLAGGAGASNAAYFDTSDEKIKEISKLLESRQETERLEGMKRIIAGISKGRDMEPFFAQVVKNVVAPSIEIRKLVYIYLLRFASTNSDLLLLSINTFQKDLADPSPLIRSMSLRVLTSIRVPVIQGIVMLGLKRLVTDRNPWVRKTVAGGLPKVFEMDPSSLPQLISLLQTLLASPSPLTLGATLTAFSEMCPDRLDLLHPYYRHICRLLVDADEWGQAVAIGVLSRYARAMLEKPEESPVKPVDGEETEDEFAGIDEDLAMLLHLSKPLFQSRSPAVVLGMAKMYYHLAPPKHQAVGQELLVAPLLRLAGSSGPEMSTLTWEVIVAMAEERPELFVSRFSSFFIHSSDVIAVKTAKLRAMSALVTAESASVAMREFKHYIRFPDDSVSEAAVRAIGHCVRTQPEVASSGLSALMRLLTSKRDVLVAQAVLVLKSVILSQSGPSTGLADPQRLVTRLARGLDGISNPKARASVYWLVGQFATEDGPDKTLGLGWDGIKSWVPDVLRKGIKGFVNESTIAKLQILTLASKLIVLSPATSQLALMSTYLFSLARYDSDYDVRDRARFLHALLRGVRDENKAVTGNENGDTDEKDDDERDMGGVVLRREQVRVVLMGKREAADSDLMPGVGSEYEVGSMSRITHKRLNGYEPLPEWTDDPTDPSLRESEQVEQPRTATPLSHLPPPPTTSSAIPTHISSVASIPRSAVTTANPSPVGSVPVNKGKFQDLDAFLDSESGEEEEDTEDER
ncbi:adaptin N terminal region-domain-containing protein [Naematelia encephala]|uniref:Adaptin N terminal region-domain-containing protein n=1 Tax=Naematelia encephala TaxID=71784 RepID=A0A1Y2AQ40_9TREE|nr:adaptin N terminal region-domain-containing protein [Naematelia encephala]